MFLCPPQNITMAQYFSQPFPKPGRNVFTILCRMRMIGYEVWQQRDMGKLRSTSTVLNELRVRTTKKQCSDSNWNSLGCSPGSAICLSPSFITFFPPNNFRKPRKPSGSDWRGRFYLPSSISSISCHFKICRFEKFLMHKLLARKLLWAQSWGRSPKNWSRSKIKIKYLI